MCKTSDSSLGFDDAARLVRPRVLSIMCTVSVFNTRGRAHVSCFAGRRVVGGAGWLWNLLVTNGYHNPSFCDHVCKEGYQYSGGFEPVKLEEPLAIYLFCSSSTRRKPSEIVVRLSYTLYTNLVFLEAVRPD